MYRQVQLQRCSASRNGKSDGHAERAASLAVYSSHTSSGVPLAKYLRNLESWLVPIFTRYHKLCLNFWETEIK
jgi:hypothetical protein